MEHLLWKIVADTWAVFGEMAPYLLFGFLAAGVLSVCVSPELVERHLGGRGIWPVLKAALFGVPLPLCSCGVIPVAAALRRHGASRAATTSFLLSTPQTGIDSIAVTYALLGLTFAVYRPVVALIMGVLGGTLIMLFMQRNGDGDEPKPADCHESCCADKGSKHLVRRVLEYGFVTLPRDIGLPLLVGALIAGALSTLVPANELKHYLGGGIVSIVLLMALGIPIYVCASASVPIAAGLMHLGASPGAALAFLISGPATNAAMVATLWKLLGGRSAILYLLTVAVGAVGAGLALDWLVAAFHTPMPPMAMHSHEAMAGGWASSGWAILLLAVVAFSFFRNRRKEPAEEPAEHADSSSGERLTLIVHGMTCGHCAVAVARALEACHGVVSAKVDVKSGRATVVGAELQPDELLAAVKAAGYRAEIG